MTEMNVREILEVGITLCALKAILYCSRDLP